MQSKTKKTPAKLPMQITKLRNHGRLLKIIESNGRRHAARQSKNTNPQLPSSFL